jgi:hypothetical protein
VLERHSRRTAIRLIGSTALATAALAAAVATAASGAPSVRITAPATETVTNERTPSFAGTAEELAGEVTLRVYAGPVPEGAAVQTLRTSLFEPGGVWTLGPVEALDEGVYTATAAQTNADLETGISPPVTFTIDTGAPVVTIDDPAPAPGESTPSFSGTASDITPVSVKIHAGDAGGAVVSSASAPGTGGEWHSGPASPALAPGAYTAVATQPSSLKGNPAGRSAPVSFEVEPAPPPVPEGGVGAAGPQAKSAAPPAAAAAHGAGPLVLMAPFPVVRVAGVAFSGGIVLKLLKVQQAPAGALVSVRCRGRGCPRRRLVSRTTVSGAHGVSPIAFRSFDRYLHAGAVIEVFVTKAGTIGKYTRLRVRRGKLPERIDKCLAAGGALPLECPSG